ncbi:MAG TPA: hypothetical protein VFM70_03745 [Salinimicrobium sp.]|nr:hypothetical protein [Salinimicrobium sp.]
MGGSGGGGYIPPQRNEFDCETSSIVTNVSSINLTVLAKHTVGTVLEVVIGKNGEVLLEDGDGEILGAILHINTPDIIDCMENGAEYQAEIQRINTPTCTVKIASI